MIPIGIGLWTLASCGSGVDPLAPGAPTIDLKASSDTGQSSTDDITNDTTPTFVFTPPSGLGAPLDEEDGDTRRIQISDNPSFSGSLTEDIDAGDMAAGAGDITASTLGAATYYARGRVERTIEAVAHPGPWSSTLTFTVDTTAPTVSTVALTSDAGVDQTYGENDVVQATVTCSKTVHVTGTPQLTLNVGGSNKVANYTSGTGSTALVFAWTVTSGSTDANGISIDANSLALNSGTIRDTAGNNATLTHSAVTDQSAHKVSAGLPNQVAFWPMDDGSGTNVRDDANDHDGTLTSSGLWSGGGIAFDGTNTGSVPDHADFAFGGAFTVFGWVNGAANAAANVLISQYDSGVNKRSWFVGLDNGTKNKLRVVLSDDGTNGAGHLKDYTGSQTLLDSTTNSFAVRFDAGTLDLFVDGSKDASVTKTLDGAITTVFNNDVALTFACLLSSGTPASKATVNMRGVRLFNAAKSDGDISALHAAGP